MTALLSYRPPVRSARERGGIFYIFYGRSDTHRHFTIYFSNPCFRVLLTGGEYIGDERQRIPDEALWYAPMF